MPLLPLSCLFYLHLISLPVALSLLPTQDLCTCSSSFFLGHSPLIGLFELLFIKYSFTYLFYSGWDGFPLPFEIRLDGVICLGICSRMSENMTQIMVCLWDRVYPLVPLSSSRGGGGHAPADLLAQGGGDSHDDTDVSIIFNLVPSTDKLRLKQLNPVYLPQKE